MVDARSVMHRPFAVIVFVLCVMTTTAQEKVVISDRSNMVELTAPSDWTVNTHTQFVSVSMPVTNGMFAPTVSVNVETIEGPRKRLDNYVTMFYSEQYAQEHRPEAWMTHDTVWQGLKATIMTYTSAYGDQTIRTWMLVAIEGEHAYVTRCMALDDCTDETWQAVRAVSATVRRRTK